MTVARRSVLAAATEAPTAGVLLGAPGAWAAPDADTFSQVSSSRRATARQRP
jgi:beta-galactosidase